MGNGSTLGAASLKGTIDWSGSEVAFADAALELDGNSAVGAFTFNYAGPRPRIEGTLALATLDLSPYLEALHSGSDQSGPGAAPALPPLDLIDADLRLSTGALVMSAIRVDKAAGGLTVNAGKLALTVGEADFYGGSLSGNATLTKFGDTYSSRVEAKLSGVDAHTALGNLADVQALGGRTDADLVLEGQGASWGEFVQRISGHGTFSLTDGAVVGLDVAELAALADSPTAPLPASSATMDFTKLGGSVALNAGILETTDTVMDGNSFRVALTGWGSLSSGVINAKARLGPLPGAGGDSQTKVVPIAVSGTWRKPVITLDREPGTASATPRG
jgi:AsmA protein